MVDALTAVAVAQGGGPAATQAQIDIATAAAASKVRAMDKISRINGVYSEHFHSETKPYRLDSRALFTEFYFDVAEGHRLTLGLRYTEDQKIFMLKQLSTTHL